MKFVLNLTSLYMWVNTIILVNWFILWLWNVIIWKSCSLWFYITYNIDITSCITITHYVLHDDGRYVMSVWTRPNQQYRVHVLPAFIWRRSRRFSLPIASVYMSNHSPHSFSQFCPTSDMFSNILYDGINLPLYKSFSKSFSR